MRVDRGKAENQSTHPIHAAKKFLNNIWILVKISLFVILARLRQ